MNQKLLNIEKIVSRYYHNVLYMYNYVFMCYRRYDLPTVVTPPPDETGLPLGKKYT